VIARADRVVIDVGTGDGRAVLARAAAEPGSFVIGLDASAAGMADSSRRAARPGVMRLPNAWFIVAAAEALPGAFADVADLVTINLPWGSLLRGVLGLDGSALRGISSLVKPGGRVEVLASVVPADRIDGVATLDKASPKIASAWAALGFDRVEMRPATIEDCQATRSTWARRLRDRPVYRLVFERTGFASLAAGRRMGDTTA
jgi:16S rRNA (adenine(1408)-N(1))-methyltransferase